MATDETLGSWLRQKRNDKELGLREAAARAGITHGYLSQLESDKVRSRRPRCCTGSPMPTTSRSCC